MTSRLNYAVNNSESFTTGVTHAHLHSHTPSAHWVIKLITLRWVYLTPWDLLRDRMLCCKQAGGRCSESLNTKKDPGQKAEQFTSWSAINPVQSEGSFLLRLWEPLFLWQRVQRKKWLSTTSVGEMATEANAICRGGPDWTRGGSGTTFLRL